MWATLSSVCFPGLLTAQNNQAVPNWGLLSYVNSVHLRCIYLTRQQNRDPPVRTFCTSCSRSRCKIMFKIFLRRKLWGFHGGDYEECHLLGYKIPVRTSHDTHFFSATEPFQLMLCKIWGFHGRDYEECCLLGYKNPVQTSQDTHFLSATEPSQLMLCTIWGFHGGDYKAYRLLGHCAVWLLYEPTYRRKISPPSSGWK
jgi:hypothetical protein